MDDIAVLDPLAHHPPTGPDTSYTGCLCKMFSRNEMKILFILAWPTVLSYCLYISLSTISLLFAGHIGKTELAAAALSISFVNVTGVSVGIGLASASETLCSQAFGAKNYKLVGIVLQRGIWILGITCFPVWTLWINTEMILLLFHQSAEISRLVQDFVLICIPALPGVYVFTLLQRYLQAQGLVRPVLYIGIINNCMHIGISSLLVYGFKLGFRGVAVSWSITYGISGGNLFLYMMIFKIHKKTWSGWSMDSLLEWGQFTGLAIPGMLMICIEWWSYEVGAFVMGYLGEIPLGAYGILIQWASLIFMIPLGLSVAAGVRVGNNLGSGDPEAAKLSTVMSLLLIVCTQSVTCLLALTLRSYMGAVFSDNKEVVELVARVLLLMAPLQLLEGLQGVSSGIIRGCGRQKVGVIINCIAYIFIQLPIANSLAFHVVKGLMGYWVGIAVALSVQVTLYLTILWRTNWAKEADLARKRTVPNQDTEATIANEDHQAPAIHTSEPLPWIYKTSSLLAISRTSLRLVQATHAHRCEPSLLSRQSYPDEKDLEDEQQECYTNDTIQKMSTSEKRTLVLRRLLPLIVCIVLLGAGLCVRLFIPLPR